MTGKFSPIRRYPIENIKAPDFVTNGPMGREEP
jgi:hypothetical protein